MTYRSNFDGLSYNKRHQRRASWTKVGQAGGSPHLIFLADRESREHKKQEDILMHGDLEAVFSAYLGANRFHGSANVGGKRHLGSMDNKDLRRFRERAIRLQIQRLDEILEDGETDPIAVEDIVLAHRRCGALGNPAPIKNRLEQTRALLVEPASSGELKEMDIHGLDDVLNQVERDHLAREIQHALERPEMGRLQALLARASTMERGPENEALEEMHGMLSEVVAFVDNEKEKIAMRAIVQKQLQNHDSLERRILDARTRSRDAWMTDREIATSVIEADSKEKAALLKTRIERNSMTLVREGTRQFLMRRLEGAVEKILAKEALEVAQGYLKKRMQETIKQNHEKEKYLQELRDAVDSGDTAQMKEKIDACKKKNITSSHIQKAEETMERILREGTAITDLQAAVKKKDIPAMKKAIAYMESIGLQKDARIPKAQELIKKLDSEAEKKKRHDALVEALKRRKIADVRAAKEACDELGVYITRAEKDKIRSMEEQAHRKLEFESAVKSGNSDRVRAAIEACQQSRVSMEFMNGAAKMLTTVEEEELHRGLRKRVEEAIRSGNKATLKETVEMAYSSGLPDSALVRGRANLEALNRKDAEKAIKVALETQNYEALEVALEEAEDCNLTGEILTKGEIGLKHLQPRHTDLSRVNRMLIEFDDGMAELNLQQKQVLFKIARILQRYPDVAISLHGHRACPHRCDLAECRDKNPEDEKPQLSVNRALHVAKALQGRGCKNPFYVKGWGCQHHRFFNSKRVVRLVASGVGPQIEDLSKRDQVRTLDPSRLEELHSPRSPSLSPRERALEHRNNYGEAGPYAWRTAKENLRLLKDVG